ncbi:MAG: hypothetical protein QCI38_00825 [Candidatus Thermoplasmatota archaeon]|nr:hypothetical protein [Candidatus Thermoplasmatota archaeon]
MVFALRLLTPLRTPAGILEHGDESYELQILRSIVGTGHIQPHLITNIASYNYQHWKGLEGLLSSLTVLTGISPEDLLKWSGLFMGILTIVLVERFYFNIFHDRKISISAAALVGVCPVLIQFDVHTVHQTLALVFFAFFLYATTKTGWFWSVLGVLSLVCVLLTHHLTSVMLLALIFITIPAYLVGKRFTKKDMALPFKPIYIVPLIILGVVVLYSTNLQGTVNFGVQSLRLDASLLHRLFPQSSRPLWMIVLVILGLFVFSIVGMRIYLKMLMKMLSRKITRLETKHIILFSSGILLTIMFYGLVIVGPAFAIKWRGLYYLFLFLSPFFVIYVFMKIFSRRRQATLLSRLSVYALAFLILLPSVFLGLEMDFYDQNSPYRQEDVRYNLEEWKQVGAIFYSLEYRDKVWGVARGGSFIGGQGMTWYAYINTDSTRDWMDDNVGSLVVIRNDIMENPDTLWKPTSQELHSLYLRCDVLVSTNEVVVLQIVR